MDQPASTSGQNAAWRAGGTPRISVVFPTYRRPESLARVLAALAGQTGLAPAEYDVVVVDDASGDDTLAALRAAAERAPHPMAWVSLTRQGGPARARNAALPLVRAPVVLLLGDDILPASDLVARHSAWHAAHADPAEALLGHTAWDETLPPNALMRWLERGGRRFAFNYRDLPVNRPVSGHFFYTCHVSFKQALLTLAGGFDEHFPFASHEDLELGLRMEQRGMRLYYDPTLVARHRHWLGLSDVCRRVYYMGFSSVRFWRTVARPPALWRRAGRWLVMGLFARGPLRRLRCWRPEPDDPQLRRTHPWRWSVLLAATYWSGAADAARGRSPSPETPAR